MDPTRFRLAAAERDANTAGGATWVSFHHGSGVGMGYSQHGCRHRLRRRRRRSERIERVRGMIQRWASASRRRRVREAIGIARAGDQPTDAGNVVTNIALRTAIVVAVAGIAASALAAGLVVLGAAAAKGPQVVASV
jgi:urocanate hydratase